jgi:formylglycine-generating enzyme required for sulfatase activity
MPGRASNTLHTNFVWVVVVWHSEKVVEIKACATHTTTTEADLVSHHRVLAITLDDARAYAAWLSQLTGVSWWLPTGAKWEKAAHGADGRIYAWGDVFDKTRANTSESGIGTTTPVGNYHSSASPCRAQDMAGNVAEWTTSIFKPYPSEATDGREDPASLSRRVLRGGAFDDNATTVRAAFRLRYSPVSVLTNVGFPLACAPST